MENVDMRRTRWGDVCGILLHFRCYARVMMSWVVIVMNVLMIVPGNSAHSIGDVARRLVVQYDLNYLFDDN